VSENRSYQELWTLVQRAAVAWLDDYAPSMGAALSYYTLFSLAPLLLIVISVAGLVFGEAVADIRPIAGLMGRGQPVP
jgi:membrane protein